MTSTSNCLIQHFKEFDKTPIDEYIIILRPSIRPRMCQVYTAEIKCNTNDVKNTESFIWWRFLVLRSKKSNMKKWQYKSHPTTASQSKQCSCNPQTISFGLDNLPENISVANTYPRRRDQKILFGLIIPDPRQ